MDLLMLLLRTSRLRDLSFSCPGGHDIACGLSCRVTFKDLNNSAAGQGNFDGSHDSIAVALREPLDC